MEMLAGADGGGRGRPVGGNEINTPEMGRGGQKLKADALAFIVGIAEKHDAAFLLLLRERIGENDHGVHAERLIEIQKSAVGVDDNRLTGFAEAALIGILSCGDHAHPHKDAGTASNLVDINCFRHDKSMLRHFQFAVNETVCSMFLQRNPTHIPVSAHCDSAMVFPYAQKDG
jgi:hypothetical protein